MTRRERERMFRESVGRDGAECPVCGGQTTEPLGCGRWLCWRCGHQFREGVSITRSQAARVAQEMVS